MPADTLRFLRAWMRDPLRVASVTPSSWALANLIVSEISFASAPVIELGAGTGVFTRALLARGLREQDLVLVEQGKKFAQMLQKRFPDTQVVCGDAADGKTFKFSTAGRAGAVVSGLPLLAIAPENIAAILTQCFDQLRPGGAMYQFTYGPRCPVPSRLLQQLNLDAIRIGSTLRNIPPATVYRISRRTDTPATICQIKAPARYR